MEIRLLVLATLIIALGCSTVEFVQKDFSPNKQATLRYPSQSKQVDDAHHREKLNQQARDFCGGDYIKTKEYQAREESRSAVGVGTGVGIGAGSVFLGTTDRGSSMYNYTEISCK